MIQGVGLGLIVATIGVTYANPWLTVAGVLVIATSGVLAILGEEK